MNHIMIDNKMYYNVNVDREFFETEMQSNFDKLKQCVIDTLKYDVSKYIYKEQGNKNNNNAAIFKLIIFIRRLIEEIIEDNSLKVNKSKFTSIERKIDDLMLELIKMNYHKSDTSINALASIKNALDNYTIKMKMVLDAKDIDSLLQVIKSF